MHPNFKDALEAGYLEAAQYNDGTPVVVGNIPYYLPTASGANLFIKRFHAIGDVLRRHNELGLSPDALHSSFALLLDLNRQILRELMRGDGETPDTSAAIEMQTVIHRLQARADLSLDVAMVYDLSALYCLDESEDPRDYDSGHNREKVLNWSSDTRLFEFFVSTPWSQWLPLQGLLSKDTQRVLQAMNTEEVLDATRTLLLRESLGLTPATISILESRRETLYGFSGLLTAG